MTRNKIIGAVVAGVLALAFVLGVTGVVPFARQETGDVSAVGGDRLVGVFITTEPLEVLTGGAAGAVEALPGAGEGADADAGAGAEALPGAELQLASSRLYATLVDNSFADAETGEMVESQTFVFEGVPGMFLFFAKFAIENGFYWGNGGDEAISDMLSALQFSDAGESIELTGTMYVSAARGPAEFIYNPVYQTARGEVYAVSGSGLGFGGEVTAGMSGSHEVRSEQTVVVDGEAAVLTTRIDIGVRYMDTPVAASVLQFDAAGEVVAAQEFAAGKLPEELRVEAGVAYVVVESRMADAAGGEVVERELYEHGAESLYAFDCRDDGMCVKQYCKLVW